MVGGDEQLTELIDNSIMVDDDQLMELIDNSTLIGNEKLIEDIKLYDNNDQENLQKEEAFTKFEHRSTILKKKLQSRVSSTQKLSYVNDNGRNKLFHCIRTQLARMRNKISSFKGKRYSDKQFTYQFSITDQDSIDQINAELDSIYFDLKCANNDLKHRIRQWKKSKYYNFLSPSQIKRIKENIIDIKDTISDMSRIIIKQKENIQTLSQMKTKMLTKKLAQKEDKKLSKTKYQTLLQTKNKTLKEMLESDNFTDVKEIAILTPDDKKIYDEIVLQANTDRDIMQMNESQLRPHISLLNLIGNMNSQLFDLENKLMLKKVSNSNNYSSVFEDTLKSKLSNIKNQLSVIYSTTNFSIFPFNIENMTRELLSNVGKYIVKIENEI